MSFSESVAVFDNGTGTQVEIKGLGPLLRDLEQMARNGRDMAGLHLDVADWVRGRQIRHYQAQEDRHGIEWPALTPFTLSLRRGTSDVPLQDTGKMRASVQVTAADNHGWSVEENAKQAAVHQYGAVILPVNYDALYIPIRKDGKRALRRTGNYIRLELAVIPAREHIYLNDAELQDMTDGYATGVATRGTKYIQWTGGTELA